MRLFLHWINLLIIVTVAISLFTEPAWADKVSPPGEEIALVNGKAISKIQYERRLSVFKKRAAHKGRELKDADLTTAKNRILEDLIDAEVLYQQSQKEGIKVNDQTINKQIEKIKKRFPDETAYKKAIERMHISEKEFRTDIQRAFAIKQLLDTNVRQKITVTDQECKKYYNNNQNLFKQTEQVKLSQIWIKVTPNSDESKKIQARKKIETIQKKIKQGEDFGKLAKTYSDGFAAKHEGVLGYIDRGHMEKPFEDAAFSLNVGEVSGILENQSGYYLIKVTDKKPAGIIPYKEVLPMIERQLKKEKKKTETQSYIENLKKSAKIKRFN
jgi:peptidyl-prolyl cis-trans isomerase C